MPDPKPIDTLNKFAVALHGDRLVILNNGSILREGLTRDDALNLAAYLACMAVVLPGETKFEDVLMAIENT